MICKDCGKRIETLHDYICTGWCRSCYNAYMKDYQESRRWLNGGPDKRLMVDDIPASMSVWDETEDKYI